MYGNQTSHTPTGLTMELKELINSLAQSGQTLRVKVTPKAASNSLVLDEDEDGVILKIRLTVVPEKGKANAALLKILAREAGIAKSSITIVSGETSRTKLLGFA